MKIGVDVGCLVDQEGGVSQMTRNLLMTLGQLDQQNQYQLYSWQPIVGFKSKNMVNIIASPKIAWSQWGLPRQLRRYRPDVFLGPAQTLPRYLPCPAVAIIHDLGFEHWPELYPAHRRLRWLTHRAAKKASRLIAVSHATAQDLINFYDLPKTKIKVAWEGCNPKDYFPSLGEKKPYFLYVGAAKPSKNLAGVVAGFAYFSARSSKNYHLKLVGGELQHFLGKSKKVASLGFVTQSKLLRLYQQATALVSPAFWEGFGLPLVEAMASGCPVIAGNTGSQAEIIGRAGILVPPGDHQAIGKALLMVASQSRLRQQLIQRGLNRTRQFQWKKFGQEVLESLNEIKS